MMRGGKLDNVAYMQEADDDTGSIIDDERTYAASQAPTSPGKERMNTGRKKSIRRNSMSPTNPLTDSDTTTVHPRRDSKARPRERDEKKSLSTSSKKVTYAPRPSMSHAKTSPVIQTPGSRRKSRDESSYYGVEPTITAASSRPRAYTSNPRPVTYYGSSSRPPPSNLRFYNTMQPPAALPPTSFPPQSWAAAGPVSYPVPQPQTPTEYLPPRQHQNLLQRFSLNRPQSAMAHRAPPPIGYGDEYEPDERAQAVARRPSLRKTKREEDRVRMPPPPPRPSTTMPMRSSPFAPPPVPAGRPSAYEDDAFEGDGSLFIEVPPTQGYDYAPPATTTTRLAHLPRRPSIVYDAGGYST